MRLKRMNLFLVRILSFPCSNSKQRLISESLDTRRGEILLGFYVRVGLCIEGIEILTSLGRKSGVFGNSKGGSG